MAAILAAAATVAAPASAAGHLTGGATATAAPFAQSWAQVPRTTDAREAAGLVVFGAEQSVDGFNTSLNCCNEIWASWMGSEEALRGAFDENQKGQWIKDLIASASESSRGVSYVIKPNAYWYWGGRRVPVTYRDFVYTLREIDDPNNDIATRDGYSNLDPARFSHTGEKRVTFSWRMENCTADFPCGPYANWESLFSSLYPSFALKGMDFNTIWMNCICGSDGRPVSDGPYYLSSYTKGQGSVLKANPFWAGRKPAIREVDFKILQSTSAEVAAMASGAVDAISPTFSFDLQSLRNAPGITFDQLPGYYFEHLEFREGGAAGGPSVTSGASNVLLRAPFIREAIAMAVDRRAIIDAVYGVFAGAVKPLNNAIYSMTEPDYRPDFRKWSFNPRSALVLMARHCTGGPRSVDPSNTKTWECSGLPAAFNWAWTSGDMAREVTEAIVKAELRSIGIQLNDMPLAPNIFFGPAGIPSGGYDIADFADITSGDPGDWYDAYRCRGPLNYTGFCSREVDALLKAGVRDEDPSRRAADFRMADAALSKTVPVLPLYQRPDVLVHASTLRGMVGSPTEFGPFWNIEDWRWSR